MVSSGATKNKTQKCKALLTVCFIKQKEIHERTIIFSLQEGYRYCHIDFLYPPSGNKIFLKE